MRRITWGVVIIGVLAFSPANSYACFCVVPSMPEAFNKASAVFVGEVVDIIAPKTSDETALLPGNLFTIKFKVEKSWKGINSDEVEVLSGQGEFGCSYPAVRKGERYLVYAEMRFDDGKYDNGWLFMNECNRTALIPKPEAGTTERARTSRFDRRDATEDLKELEGMSTPSHSFRSGTKIRKRSKSIQSKPRGKAAYHRAASSIKAGC